MAEQNEQQAAFSLDVDRLRLQYLGSRPGAPADVVSRKIWMAIVRYRRPGTATAEQDLHQSAYEAVLTNFARIVTRFAESGRAPTKGNFDAWLTVCIRNLVVDAMRRQPPRWPSLEEFGNTDWPAPESDLIRQMRMQALFAVACEALSPIEQDLVEKRLADGEKPAALARQYGLPTEQVYRMLYDAKLKLRNALVRTIVEDKLTRDPVSRRRYHALIEHRCTLQHPCYFYRDPCPLASPAGPLFDAVQVATADDLHDREAEAAGLVRDLLDDWDLPPALDKCFWAATEGRGKIAPVQRISS